MPSDAQLAANRRNAQKSTGPRSTEGKAVSRLNALKHGMRAEDVVLPNEDPEEYARRLEEWTEAYAPDDPAGQYLVDRAVRASWRLDRCARAERAMLAERVEHATADHDRAALDHAEELGRRLVFDPDDSSRSKRDPHECARLDRRAADHPAVLKRALEASAQGVDWLLARWVELDHLLTTFGRWEIPQAHLAARLLGRRPEDSLEDPVVTMLLLNMLRTMQPPGFYLPTYDAFARLRLLDSSRPVSQAHVQILEDALPPTCEEARATLHAFIAAEIVRLRALKEETLDDRAQKDRDSAFERAQFDDSPSAVLLRRYDAACERELRRAATELRKRVAERETTKVSETTAPNEPNSSRHDAPQEPPQRTRRDLSYSRNQSIRTESRVQTP
jgi:hypothetical protein